MTNLTDERRQALCDFMLSVADGCFYKLERGAVKKAAKTFNVSTKTVYRIWSRAKENLHNGKGVDVRSGIKETVVEGVHL